MGVMNRLAESTSPYLLAHAENPVDWQHWGEAAFAEARERDVPVLISIGYAACHWCHVMARESFSDSEVAAALNQDFVCVKVDREEHPEVDAIYMRACLAATGQGGWPMTVFTDTEGRPFFADTYFPRAKFLQLIAAVADTWRNRREGVAAQAAMFHEAIAAEPIAGALPQVYAVVEELINDEDRAYGGFGGAPKFPPSATLLALTRYAERTGKGAVHGLVRRCLHAMIRGGIFDQAEGGFARYSVDRRWDIPHFEKMAYDNGLLLRAMAAHVRATGDPLVRRALRQTAEFALTLRAEGGFISSIDADTDGKEGGTYLVSADEVSPSTARVFGITEDSVPTYREDAPQYNAAREELRKLRRSRPQPGRDTKVIAAWSAMIAIGLIEAAQVLEDDALRLAAVDALRELRETHRLHRVGEIPGVLEDFAWQALAWARAGEPAVADEYLEAAERFAKGGGEYFDSDPIAGMGLRARETTAPAALAEAWIYRERDASQIIAAHPFATGEWIAVRELAPATVTVPSWRAGYNALRNLHSSAQLVIDPEMSNEYIVCRGGVCGLPQPLPDTL